MADITLKTRLLNKFSDAAVNSLGKGEINFYPVKDKNGVDVAIMQVGSNDGTIKTFAANAADVYAWAKAANKPVYQASEIEGLENFIAGEIQDTNTKYSFKLNANGELIVTETELNGSSRTAATIDFVTPNELTTVLADYVTTSALNTTLANYVTSNDFNLHKVDNDTKIAEAKKAGTDAAAALATYEAANDAALADVKATADAAAVKADVEASIEEIEGAIADVKATADAAAVKTDVEATVTEINGRIDGVKATADAAAVKADVDAKFVTVDANIVTANDRIDDLVEVTNAHYEAANAKFAALEAADEDLAADIVAAEAAAKTYADKIKADLLGNSETLEGTYDTLKEIHGWITKEGVDATDLASAIAGETAAREAADAVFTQADADLDAAIAAEAETRAAADAALDGKITAEAAVRAQGDTDTLASAKTYTDEEIVKAKAYADQAEADAIATAAADAKSKANKALADAKAYANSLEHKDTTYTAGEGLVLNGTVFSIDKSLTFILDANA